MLHTPENVAELEAQLCLCKEGCDCKEKLNLQIIGDYIMSATAYCDNHYGKNTKNPPYYRPIYVRGVISILLIRRSLCQ